MNNYLIILLFATGYLSSQNFSAGLILGVNTSQVSGDNLSGFNKLSFKAGGAVIKNINSLIGQLELIYIKKGSREIIVSDMYEEGYNLSINYIEIPCLLKYKIKDKIYVETGLGLGYVLGWTEKVNGYETLGLDVSLMEYNFYLGFNYEIQKNIHLNSRFSNSIAPIRPHSSGQTYRLNKGQYNTCISFCLYYYI